MLLEISIAQSDFGDMTLFHTIQEVIGRINIEKWIDFHRQRRDAYDPIALLTIILFAYARYGYASLRQLEEMSRYDLRCRLILQGQTPSYKAYQRFINHQLKGSIEELSHQVYLCIQNQKALEEAGIAMASAEVTMIPQNYVELTDETAIKNLNRTLDLLDDDDDVQAVYHNWDE